MTSSSCQLCNSQNIANNFMGLLFFLKNVNKQLKSADFLSEMSKFQKILLSKVLAFFILMTDNTLVFVVQPPNIHKSNNNTHILLFTNIPFPKTFHRQFFDILSKIWHFWILWKEIKNKLGDKSSKLKKLQNM